MAGERQLALLEAPVRPIAAGDDFVVRAGCDKRLETCRDRFANVVELPRLPAHPRPGHGDPLPEPRRRQQRETCCDKPPIRRVVIAAARGWLGTPYHDQASVKGVGCDCLGLVRGVWRELYGAEPLPLPPYSRDWGETGTREPLAEAARHGDAGDRR